MKEETLQQLRANFTKNFDYCDDKGKRKSSNSIFAFFFRHCSNDKLTGELEGLATNLNNAIDASQTFDDFANAITKTIKLSRDVRWKYNYKSEYTKGDLKVKQLENGHCSESGYQETYEVTHPSKQATFEYKLLRALKKSIKALETLILNDKNLVTPENFNQVRDFRTELEAAYNDLKDKEHYKPKSRQVRSYYA